MARSLCARSWSNSSGGLRPSPCRACAPDAACVPAVARASAASASNSRLRLRLNQVAVAGFAQPGDLRLRGDAPVHDHQGVGRGAKPRQHPLQRGVLAHVAGEHPGPAHEPRAVQHQPEREQGTVAALLLGMPVPRQRLLARLALEVGVCSASTISSTDDN